MTYCFHGFLTRDLNPRLALIAGNEDGIVAAKRINDLFIGHVILLASLAEDRIGLMADHPDKPTVISKLADRLFSANADWLFLHYQTWGGAIDYIEACGRIDGLDIAPLYDDNDDTMKATFIEQMGKFGISPSDALNFQPFARGFF